MQFPLIFIHTLVLKSVLKIVQKYRQVLELLLNQYTTILLLMYLTIFVHNTDNLHISYLGHLV